MNTSRTAFPHGREEINTEGQALDKIIPGLFPSNILQSVNPGGSNPGTP